jgi:DNA (cytosine-5)-methyltransferase 1
MKVLGFDRAAYNQGKNAKFSFTILENEQPTLTAKGLGGVAYLIQSVPCKQEITKESAINMSTKGK